MQRLALALLAIGLLATLCPAQAGEAPGGQTPAPQPRPEALVAQLGSDDYAVRAAATKQLRALGEKGRPALEQGCRSESLEVSTRARLLLDELNARRAETPGEPGREPARPGRLVPEPPRPGGEAPPLPPRMRELDELMKRLRTQLGAGPMGGVVIEEIIGELNRPFVQVDRGTSSSKTRLIRGDEILEMERRPDGSLRFTVTPAPRPGVQAAEPEVFEAANPTEFRVRHPEIHARYRDTGLFEDRRDGFSIVLGGRGLEIPLVVDPPAVVAPGAGAGLLQVLLEPVPEVLRAHVAAIPEGALLVSEVTPNGPGHRLGLRPYDVITRIDGRPVRSAAEVRRVLEDEQLSAGPTIEIDIVRGGVERQLAGPRPEGR